MTKGQEIKRGETYQHDEHGQVEVIGIWRGVHSADSTHETKDSDVIIVLFTPEDSKNGVEELTDTLDEFLEKIE